MLVSEAAPALTALGGLPKPATRVKAALSWLSTWDLGEWLIVLWLEDGLHKVVMPFIQRAGSGFQAGRKEAFHQLFSPSASQLPP